MDLSVVVRFLTLTVQELHRETSQHDVMQLWVHIFIPSSTENPESGTGFSNKDIPQEICLDFFHVSPWEKFTNPASILAQFFIIWASKLDVVHGLCYCVFIYSAGPSLIPKKAVL